MPDLPALADRRALLSHLAAVGTVAATMGLVSPALALRPRADSPDVAIDPLLVDTGLAARWGAAMRRDLGWAAQWRPLGSRQVLDQLESGDAEVGMFLSHPRAAFLEKEGLIHDRRPLARTEVWLAGPADDPAGIRTEKDPARAIAQVLAAQAAGVASWQTDTPGEADGPLAHLAAKLMGASLAAGSVAKPGARPAGAPALPTYRLVTQASWLRQGAPTKGPGAQRVWFQGHPELVLHAEIARSFRARHPGGKLLVSWLERPLARSAVRGTPGWQAPGA